MTPYEDYIAHHGILGMKWGRKNGPPYPLSRSVSTGSRLKTIGNKKRVVRSGGSPEYKKQSRMNRLADKVNSKVDKINNKFAKTDQKLSEKSKQVTQQAKTEVKTAKEEYSKAKAVAKQAGEAYKEKVLKEGSAKEVSTLFNKLSDNELQQVYKRLNTEKLIREMIPKDKTKWDDLEVYTKRTGQIADALNASIRTYQNSQQLVKLINDAINKSKKDK